MRISVKIISILVLLTAIAVIMACDTNTIPSEESTTLPVTYTVAFRSQFNDPESITTMPNPTTKTVTTPATTIDKLPTKPTMSGYIFGGWYTAPNASSYSFDENYPVNDATTFNSVCSSMSVLPSILISVTDGLPSVMVPVLSNTIV